ncbi:hypothetical protein HZ326_25676 [Fusarium oxysporum f. sp. albedinis]|nr:hypothetical protein HZ326_25676 [Fusarium oxysporum f. sp. albedinis]
MYQRAHIAEDVTNDTTPLGTNLVQHPGSVLQQTIRTNRVWRDTIIDPCRAACPHEAEVREGKLPTTRRRATLDWCRK